MSFDKRQTNIAKGVAVLLLLWHHLFYNNPERYSDFVSLFYFKSVPIECFFADFCKVCVSIFLLLSGYGLYKSFEKFEQANSVSGKLSIKKQVVFVKNHLLKLMFGFWFIYLIFVPMGILFGRPFWEVYEFNPLYFITDFFGLSSLFGTPTMNPTWWYMRIAIGLYLLLPVLYKVLKYSAELLLSISFFALILPIPYFERFKIWLFPFVLGLCFSKYNLFDKFEKRLNSGIKKTSVCFLVVAITAYLRRNPFYANLNIDAFFAVAVVLFAFLLLSKIPVLNKFFEELGKYSAQIFMFHTFIYSNYFKDLIYGCKYSLLIFIVMTIVCYIIARLLEWLKHIVRYDRLLIKLTK